MPFLKKLKYKLELGLFEIALIFSAVQISLTIENSFNPGVYGFLIAIFIFLLAVIFNPKNRD